MKTTSMALRSILSLFMATSDVAPQSISALISLPTRWRQVLNRPPEPKASPQPTNCRCMKTSQLVNSDLVANDLPAKHRRAADDANVASGFGKVRDGDHNSRSGFWPAKMCSTPCLL